MRFPDRSEAGRQLAVKLSAFANRHDVVVLRPAARRRAGRFRGRPALERALDIFLVRKLGVPGHPELAMGAIASGGGARAERETSSISSASRGRRSNRWRSANVSSSNGANSCIAAP